MRSLQRDVIEIISIPEVEDSYGSIVKDVEAATVVATGYASVQMYVSTEDDVDRSTRNRYAKLISDDPRLFGITYKHSVRVYGEIWECDGHPTKWYRDGSIHHIEQTIQSLEG